MTVKTATCYKDQTSTNFQINIIGTLNSTINTPNGTTNFTQGDQILLRAHTTDDCQTNTTALNTSYFKITNGTFTDTCTAPAEGLGWYNCTWNSANNKYGYWNITYQSGLDSHNNDTGTTTFFLSSTPTLFAASVTPASGGWGQPQYTYTINITDPDGDNVTVNFYTQNSTDNGEWELTK